MDEQQQYSQQPPEQRKRVLPRNELDFNLMTTEGEWGKDFVNAELKDRLNKYYLKKDQDGQPIFDVDGNLVGSKKSLWDMLGYYTKDMRLANLNYLNGEIQYCQYYLDLAGDFLHADMIEPFIISLSRVATILELSQSKGGFLRRRMHTLTSENMQGELEPQKKNFFGLGKKKEY